MPRPAPRTSARATAAPRGDVEADAPPKASPSGGVTILVVGTLLIGACSGYANAGEAVNLLKTGGTTELTTSGGGAPHKQPVQVVGSGLATTAGATGIVYVVGCGVAVLFAILLLAQGWPTGWQKALAVVAAALTLLRLVLVALEYEMLDDMMAVMQASLRGAGYGYPRTGKAMAQAADLGSTTIVLLGVGVALFWLVTAFVFWSRATAEDEG